MSARSALYAGAAARAKLAAQPREVKGERHKLYGDTARSRRALRRTK